MPDDLRPLTYPDATRRLATARARAAGRAERQQEHLKRHMNTTHEEQLRIARDESRNDAMRRAIAEACGCRVYIRPYDDRTFLCRSNPAKWRVVDAPADVINTDVPNYPADLNAMHEAEKGLSSGQWLIYEHALQSPFAVKGDYSHRHIIHATAIQRAEAFCRTLKIGPYKETTT